MILFYLLLLSIDYLLTVIDVQLRSMIYLLHYDVVLICYICWYLSFDVHSLLLFVDSVVHLHWWYLHLLSHWPLLFVLHFVAMCYLHLILVLLSDDVAFVDVRCYGNLITVLMMLMLRYVDVVVCHYICCCLHLMLFVDVDLLLLTLLLFYVLTVCCVTFIDVRRIWYWYCISFDVICCYTFCCLPTLLHSIVPCCYTLPVHSMLLICWYFAVPLHLHWCPLLFVHYIATALISFYMLQITLVAVRTLIRCGDCAHTPLRYVTFDLPFTGYRSFRPHHGAPLPLHGAPVYPVTICCALVPHHVDLIDYTLLRAPIDCVFTSALPQCRVVPPPRLRFHCVLRARSIVDSALRFAHDRFRRFAAHFTARWCCCRYANFAVRCDFIHVHDYCRCALFCRCGRLPQVLYTAVTSTATHAPYAVVCVGLRCSYRVERVVLPPAVTHCLVFALILLLAGGVVYAAALLFTVTVRLPPAFVATLRSLLQCLVLVVAFCSVARWCFALFRHRVYTRSLLLRLFCVQLPHTFTVYVVVVIYIAAVLTMLLSLLASCCCSFYNVVGTFYLILCWSIPFCCWWLRLVFIYCLPPLIPTVPVVRWKCWSLRLLHFVLLMLSDIWYLLPICYWYILFHLFVDIVSLPIVLLRWYLVPLLFDVGIYLLPIVTTVIFIIVVIVVLLILLMLILRCVVDIWPVIDVVTYIWHWCHCCYCHGIYVDATLLFGRRWIVVTIIYCLFIWYSVIVVIVVIVIVIIRYLLWHWLMLFVLAIWPIP